MNDERRESEEEDGDHHKIVSVCLSLSRRSLNHERIGKAKETVDSEHDREWNKKKKAEPMRLYDGFRAHGVCSGLTTKLSDRRAVSVDRKVNVQVAHDRKTQSWSAVRCSALVELSRCAAGG